MATVRVLVPFYDLAHKVDRRAGDEFAASEKRAAQIDAALPGFIEIVEEATAEEPDLSDMTLKQLSLLAEERGITLKGRITKARLIEALTKE